MRKFGIKGFTGLEVIAVVALSVIGASLVPTVQKFLGL